MPRRRVTNIELTEEQFQILDRYLGTTKLKGKVFGFIVDDLIEELELDAPTFLTGILRREIHLQDFLRGTKE